MSLFRALGSSRRRRAVHSLPRFRRTTADFLRPRLETLEVRAMLSHTPAWIDALAEPGQDWLEQTGPAHASLGDSTMTLASGTITTDQVIGNSSVLFDPDASLLQIIGSDQSEQYLLQ